MTNSQQSMSKYATYSNHRRVQPIREHYIKKQIFLLISYGDDGAEFFNVGTGEFIKTKGKSFSSAYIDGAKVNLQVDIPIPEFRLREFQAAMIREDIHQDYMVPKKQTFRILYSWDDGWVAARNDKNGQTRTMSKADLIPIGTVGLFY